MMWERLINEPLTVERHVAVRCPETNQQGFVSVRWPGQQGNRGVPSGPEFYGPVWDYDWNNPGPDEDTGSERIVVLDKNPTFAGGR